MWDIFICHASEDKQSFALPLAEALEKAGLEVWYDEFILTLGDSLHRRINQGLAQSRYGAVILSPHFFAKEWSQRELDGLMTKEISTGKTVLPIWHHVTREEVERYSPLLADKLGVSTERGLEHVVEEILRVVRAGMPTESVPEHVVEPPGRRAASPTDYLNQRYDEERMQRRLDVIDSLDRLAAEFITKYIATPDFRPSDAFFQSLSEVTSKIKQLFSSQAFAVFKSMEEMIGPHLGPRRGQRGIHDFSDARDNLLKILHEETKPKEVNTRATLPLKEAVIVTDENDIMNILKDWVQRELRSGRTTITFSGADDKLHFQRGTAKRYVEYIKSVAREFRYRVDGESGNQTIRFKSMNRTGV